MLKTTWMLSLSANYDYHLKFTVTLKGDEKTFIDAEAWIKRLKALYDDLRAEIKWSQDVMKEQTNRHRLMLFDIRLEDYV